MAIASMVAFGVMVMGGSTAHAAQGISFSHTGSSWAESLQHPLFDPSVRWVPGDVRTATFYVRNDTQASAHMDVDILASSVDELIVTGDLRIEIRIAGGRWFPTTTAGTQRLASRVAAPGDSHRVDVRVEFLSEATNQSQQLPLELELRVRLTESVDPLPDSHTQSPAGGASSGQDGAGGVLPLLGDTGASVSLAMLVGGIVAAGAGAVLARRRGRVEDGS